MLVRADKTIPQIALAWLLTRPTVSSVIIDARNETQLCDNLGAIDWFLTPEQIQRLDDVSSVKPAYPYLSYHIDKSFKRPSPPLV